MNKTKMALIYDFDHTLSPKDMQEFSFFEDIGISEAKVFWDEVKWLSEKNKMDSILTYMFLMMKKAHGFTKEELISRGEDIHLFNGVEEWFGRINKFAAALDIEIEHYIISSGLEEMIQGTKIKDEFKKIYACSYFYNSKSEAVWPARVVNYTTKTQYLFRINKGILDECNDIDLNKSTPDTDKYVPFERMIYIGDGFTDVPCMKVVSQFGGNTIAVYENEETKRRLAEPLFNDKRATFIAEADYSEGSRIDTIIKSIIQKIAFDLDFDKLRNE